MAEVPTHRLSQTTGGRNGYGAKLANIYSTEFVVETCDGRGSGTHYRQVFRENMSKRGDPVMKPCKESDNWTKVSCFSPVCMSTKPGNVIAKALPQLFATENQH